MKTSFNKLVVVGSIAYDEIMDYPALFIDQINPEKLHQINISFVVDKMEKRIGGTGTNISYNYALLANNSPLLCSAVGIDGEDFITFCQKNNIDSSAIIHDKKQYTAKGTAVTDLKDNQIWGFYYGACGAGEEIDFGKHIDDRTFMIISATHKNAYMHAQNYAINHKIPFMYDCGMTMSWITNEALMEGIRNCTYLIGNDYEIAQVESRLGMSVRDMIKNDKIVITTLGEDGVNYKSHDEEYTVPAFKTNIVDPTGAGDAWRGGFLAAIIEGKEVLESLKQGNALASFAVETYGTVQHKPTKEQIELRIKKLKN